MTAPIDPRRPGPAPATTSVAAVGGRGGVGLRIRCFGAMVVTIDGAEHAVTAPRQRAVLSRLAERPGVSVSADRLLTDIWGDDQPSNGVKAVAYQVNRLRDLLEPERDGPGRHVVTDAAGYRLAVEDVAVDLLRFERLVDDARAATDDPDKAVALCEDALALWRGEPLADVDERVWVTETKRRLYDLRQQAERTLVMARVANGDHRRALPDLQRLVRSHPTQEGLVADLMRTLRALGRTADALQAYADLRRHLAEELGLDPSHELQELQAALLADEAPAAERSEPAASGAVPSTGTTATTPPKDNIPPAVDTFVGREAEAQRVSAALASGDLVTVAGPGGSGKTRLALETARGHRDTFDHGAWFVQFAPLSDPGLVMTAIADTFGLRAGEGAPIEQVVTRWLATRRMLLVLDNAEHLVDAVADAAATIRRAAPDVRLLVTSRESLGLPGETVVRLDPLPAGGDDTPAEVLLLDRARAVRPELPRDDTDRAALASICERVDAMPLGLELAAARLRTFEPSELAEQLATSLRAVGSTGRRGEPRHRTLHATVDWSVSLLSSGERRLYRRLSVFPAPFDLEAAVAVADEGSDRWDVLDRLDALVDKSLVLRSEDAVGTRFRMLVPVKEHANAALRAEGAADETRLRHALHYLDRARELAPATRGPGQVSADQAFDADLHHLRRAASVLLDVGRGDDLLDLGFEMYVYVNHVGLQVETRDLLLHALETFPDADPVRRVKSYFVVGSLGAEVTDPRAVEHAERGLDEARMLADPALEARMELILAATIRHSTLDETYADHLERARASLAADLGAPWWEPEWDRGLLHYLLAFYAPLGSERRLVDAEVAVDGFAEAGDAAMHAIALVLGVDERFRADPEDAIEAVARSAAILEGLHVPYWHAHALLQLGLLRSMLGQHTEAADAYEQAAPILDECGDLNCWAQSVRLAAKGAQTEGRLAEAHQALLEVVDVLPVLPLGDVHRALLLDQGASLLLRSGRPEAAARLLGAGSAIAWDSERYPRADDRVLVHEELRQTLGPDRTERLLQAGHDAGADAAIALLVEEFDQR